MRNRARWQAIGGIAAIALIVLLIFILQSLPRIHLFAEEDAPDWFDHSFTQRLEGAELIDGIRSYSTVAAVRTALAEKGMGWRETLEEVSKPYYIDKPEVFQFCSLAWSIHQLRCENVEVAPDQGLGDGWRSQACRGTLRSTYVDESLR